MLHQKELDYFSLCLRRHGALLINKVEDFYLVQIGYIAAAQKEDANRIQEAMNSFSEYLAKKNDLPTNPQ